VHVRRSTSRIVVLGKVSVAFVFLLVALGTAGLRVAAAPAQKQMLSCTPAVLTNTSTLTLHFALPHPAELSVQAPDGTIYLLVYDPNTPGQEPVVDKLSFRKMANLELHVPTATGSPLVYGRNSNERIFQARGTYIFTLADVIETDAVEDVYRCKVTFTPRR
jgi:hypothetical protein